MVERCVLALTNENSWVLDPYSGVGSTVIASLKNNRNVIGIDKEAEYLILTEERIKKLKNGTLKLRPINKPIHIPTENDKISKIPEEWLFYKDIK